MIADAVNTGVVVIGGAVLAVAFLATLAVLILIAICAAIYSAIARRWRARRHDVGPDALRLLEDLDKHLDAFALDDPEVAAGLARLHAAVRDDRQGEAS